MELETVLLALMVGIGIVVFMGMIALISRNTDVDVDRRIDVQRSHDMETDILSYDLGFMTEQEFRFTLRYKRLLGEERINDIIAGRVRG